MKERKDDDDEWEFDDEEEWDYYVDGDYDYDSYYKN